MVDVHSDLSVTALIGRLLQRTWQEWYRSRTFELGAALAFYAIFSIAPIMVLAFSAASLMLGNEVAQGRLTQEIESTVGQTVANAIQATARYTYRSGSSIPATVLSIVFFAFGATGLFGQLQSALNAIWKVSLKPGRGLRGGLHDQLGPFVAVLGISASCWLMYWSRPSSPHLRSHSLCASRPRSPAVVGRHLRSFGSVPHAGHRVTLPYFAGRQDRLAKHLGGSGLERSAALIRQSLDWLVSGRGRYRIRVWCQPVPS